MIKTVSIITWNILGWVWIEDVSNAHTLTSCICWKLLYKKLKRKNKFINNKILIFLSKWIEQYELGKVWFCQISEL
jgi:hypothetical protein